MNRRKKKLIRLDLQLKVVFITLFVSCFVLLINFELNLAALWSLSYTTPNSGGVDAVLDWTRVILIRKFLISTAIALPLAATIGIIYSFKFSGPIYRFKKYFTDLALGQWDQPCNLRKGDDLKDICEAINTAVNSFRERLLKGHELLEETRRFLDEGFVAASGSVEERSKTLRERIAEECSLWEERLGIPSSQEKMVEKLELTP